MGKVHDILEAKGRDGALQAGLERAIVDAASAYMGDEDNALGFVYAGWASVPYLIPSCFLMLLGAFGQKGSGYWWNLDDDR